MNKKILKNIILATIIFCGLQPKTVKAEDGVGLVVGAAVVAGATYVGYRAWNLYRTYCQERTFAQAKELLKQASFWGSPENVYAVNGMDIVNAINTLALQHYQPALYFQAEHPWLFVDTIISEFAPQVHPQLFYARYARYSIEKYQKLAALGDVQGHVCAGNLGIAWLYVQYAHGVSYTQVAHEVNEFLGYLDAAACLGHQGSVNEIIRIYQEGLLVKYNQRLIAELPGYYRAIQQMNNSIYPISSCRIWLFKQYYNTLSLTPVAP